MAGCKHLLALALLLLAVAAPASAGAWQRVAGTTDKLGWTTDVLPSGVGYAANERILFSSVYQNFTHTTDGGKTWKKLAQPIGAMEGFHTLGTGGVLLVVGNDYSNGNALAEPMLWSASTGKWATHKLELPKVTGIPQTMRMRSIAPVPWANQAFGSGWVTTKNDSADCVWRWNGVGTTWKVTKMAGSIKKVIAASPTAAWISVSRSGPYSAGDILRWDGKAWVHQRKGTADEDIQLLRAVPPAGKTPAMVWAKLTTIKNGQAPSEALLLCDTAKCTSKKAAGTTSKYPGSFLTNGFDAAGPSFALVWEAQPSNNPNLTAVHLQQFNGAKWTTVLKVNRQTVPDGPPQPWGQPTITSPKLHISVASPTQAVVTITNLLPATGKTATVVTHTWNGAKWTKHADNAFTKPKDSEAMWQQLQALDSGSALRTMVSYDGDAGGMWRLA